ncbi:MAG TPA: site-specific integrase [Candidatus Acidoferrales bacterium]|nr:site-specific integrase [Candidatus Acidoferrales bacterium]
MSSFKKDTLEQFINANGFEIVKELGVTAAAHASGLSRPTVYTILQAYKKQPTLRPPTDEDQWAKCEGAKLFLAKHRNRIKTWKKSYRIGMVSWLFLGKKDPFKWTVDDYRTLWNNEGFTDSMTKRIRDTAAFSLRLWMRTLGKEDFLKLEDFSRRGLRRPKSRKTWFLEDKDLIELIKKTQRHDLLEFEDVGFNSGGRGGSILGIRPLDCNFEKNIVLMFESKTNDYRPRFINEGCMARLKRYIKDYNIAPDKPLFPSYSTIRTALKKVAKEANIPQLASMKGATHIFKHTFVTQGAFHNLSMESISQQTGTNPTTLQGFYVGVKENKLRHELLGEKLDVLPFHEWTKTFDDLLNQQYDSIPVQKKTKQPEKTAGKRPINWTAIKKLTENPSTPEPLRRYWQTRLQKEKEGSK